MQRFVSYVFLFDAFALPAPQFRASKDSETKKSLLGVIFSLFIFGVTTLYAVKRVDVFINKSDVIIRVVENDNFFAETETLSLTIGQNSTDADFNFRMAI